MTPVAEWVPITKFVVERTLAQARPELVVDSSGPAWAVIITEVAWFTVAWAEMSLGDMLAKAEQDQDLQLAITGAYRINSSAFVILNMIESWSKT